VQGWRRSHPPRSRFLDGYSKDRSAPGVTNASDMYRHSRA
jgi:hypothetical protein